MIGNENKISRLLGTARAISFPAGRPPEGTCEFATKTCLKECGDREPNSLLEHKAYGLFCKLSCDELVSRLMAEVQTAQNKVLSWFPESGDCPRRLVSKIINVIKGLSVPQNGFTRNKKLWELSQSIPNVRMVLTVESEDVVCRYKEKGLVGIPNYYERRVKIVKADKTWLCGGGHTCGCGNVEDEANVSEEDCGLCWQLSRGCYAA